NDVADAGNARHALAPRPCPAGHWWRRREIARRRLTPGARRPRTGGLTGGAFGSQRHHYLLDPFQALYRPFGGFAHRFEFLRALRVDGEGKCDLAVGDGNLGDKAERDEISFEIWPLDLGELSQNLFLGNHVAEPVRSRGRSISILTPPRSHRGKVIRMSSGTYELE